MSRAELGVAVVGAGRFGRRIIDKLGQVRGCHLKAVCDPDPLRLGGMRLERGCALDRDVRATLERSDVDALLIATPIESHATLAERALGAGKHVLVEKPLAMSSKDASRVLDAQRRSGCRLMVGHLLAFHPLYERLESLVLSDSLGRLEHIETCRGTLQPLTESSRLWWELAPHDLYFAVAWGLRLGRVQGSLATGQVTMRFEDSPFGFECRVAAGTTTERSWAVRGSLAVARLGEHQPDLGVHVQGRSQSVWSIARVGAARRDAKPPDPLRRELEHFVGAVASGNEFRVSTEHAAKTVALLEAGAAVIDSLNQALEKPSASFGPPKGKPFVRSSTRPMSSTRGGVYG